MVVLSEGTFPTGGTFNGAIRKLNFLVQTEFPGVSAIIWTYLRRDVDIFSIWAFLRALRQRILHGLVVPLCGTSWDKLDWDRFHRGHRACPATRRGLQRGYMTCPWDKDRPLLTCPSPSGTGLGQAQPVPLGQAQLVPICLSHWDRLCLSQWLLPVGKVWYRHHLFLIKNQRGPNRILEIPYQTSVSN